MTKAIKLINQGQVEELYKPKFQGRCPALGCLRVPTKNASVHSPLEDSSRTVDSNQRAVRKRRASPAGGPTSWTPNGIPEAD